MKGILRVVETGSDKERAIWKTVARQCQSEVLFLPGHYGLVFSLSGFENIQPPLPLFRGASAAKFSLPSHHPPTVFS